jgi:hypothetical protein
MVSNSSLPLAWESTDLPVMVNDQIPATRKIQFKLPDSGTVAFEILVNLDQDVLSQVCASSLRFV